jgi:hypothetical protein
MTPGKHAAKIDDYGIGKNKEDKPYVFINFKLSDTGESIKWFGHLGDAKGDKKSPREITLQTILRMGFRGDDVHDLADGRQSRMLDESVEYELVLENNTYNGKTSLRVKFINTPQERLTGEEAKRLASYKSELSAMRSELGIKKPSDTDDDIPF